VKESDRQGGSETFERDSSLNKAESESWYICCSW